MITRILIFTALLLLSVAAPWYLVIGICILIAMMFGWVEMLPVAMVLDAVSGAGYQLSAIPWATVAVGGVLMVRIAIQPLLLRRGM